MSSGNLLRSELRLIFLRMQALNQRPTRPVRHPIATLLRQRIFLISRLCEYFLSVLDHEPHLALFVPDDDPLLFYRAVAAVASEHLRPGGLCIVEINESFGEATAALFRSRGFSEVKVVQDLNMRDRFVYSIR